MISPSSVISTATKRKLIESDDLEKRASPVGATLRSNDLQADLSNEQRRLSDSMELLRDADLRFVSGEEAEVLGGREATSNINYVSADDIECLFYDSKLDTTLVGLDLVESTVLLLKNGWAYRGLRSSPLDLVLPQPEVEAEGQWSQWRTTADNSYELLDSVSGSWQSVPGVKVNTRPLEPSDIAGQFLRARTQNWGGAIFTSEQTLTLTADGKFGTSRSNLASAGGGGSLVPQTSTIAYHAEGAGGTTTVVSGVSDFGDGVATATLSDTRLLEVLGDRVGNFSLLDDGLTIEFHYANGEVKRELFFHHENHVFVEDRSFTRQSRSTEGFMLALHAQLMYRMEGGAKNWLAEIAKTREKHGHTETDNTTGAVHPTSGQKFS